MPDYRVESFVVDRPEDLEQQWVDLQQRANCSYFQSWGWIGTWLMQIAIDLKPVVIKVWSGKRLVGLGLFVSADIKRHIIIHSKAMFLNEYPFEGKNMVIEYNGLLAEIGHECNVYAETVKHLFELSNPYDEFHFGAIEEGPVVDLLRNPDEQYSNTIINEESTSWQVDLARFETGLDGYLASLSKNRHAQIRRSLRLYEEQGSLSLCQAENIQQALDFFDGLRVLHTERMQSKYERGSFANLQRVKFFKSLILSRFEQGEIQLLKVDNGRSTIGYLYNFIWRNRVYVLHNGFKITADKRLMPGYVVHALAINYNKEKGMAIYDLMHGDSLYKQILCNQSQKLYWIALQRHRFKFSVEKVIVGLVRRVRALSA